MIVYHGSTEIIQKPDVLHSYRLLDFDDQIAFTTQKAIDKLLIYDSYFEV